jgi:hypothetical protein
MSATSPIDPGPPPPGADDGLQELGEELQRRWDARLVRCHAGGELDVRLEVSRPGGPAVELLGPWADAPCGDRWQAVRITPDGRVVWCGPSRSCSRAELTRFVEELLRRDPEQLAERYTPLG